MAPRIPPEATRNSSIERLHSSPSTQRQATTQRDRQDEVVDTGSSPTVHLLCGLPAAGKTTYARELAAARRAVRFTLDEWMLRIHGLPYDDPRYAELLAPCQDLIWDTALQVLSVGHDVVLDWNQWSRARRARWRERATAAGYGVLVHHLEVPLEEAIARAIARAGRDPVAHRLDIAGVRHLAALLEPPSPAEGAEVTRSLPPDPRP